MTSVKLIMFVLYCVQLSIHCKSLNKVPCSYDDEECLTLSTRAVYPKIVAGRPGQVEASDPLNRDVIDMDLPNLSYILFNATLYGMQECSVKDVIVNSKEALFIYQIWCPSLRVESDYQAEGRLDDIFVEGIGLSKIFYKDYEIILKGNYGKYVDPSGDLHTNITNFKLELSAEKIKQEFTGITFYNKNKDIIETPLEEQFTKLEKIIRQPMMYSFLRKYVKNLNAFLKIVPVKDIHYHITNVK